MLVAMVLLVVTAVLLAVGLWRETADSAEGAGLLADALRETDRLRSAADRLAAELAEARGDRDALRDKLAARDDELRAVAAAARRRDERAAADAVQLRELGDQLTAERRRAGELAAAAGRCAAELARLLGPAPAEGGGP